MPHPIMFSDDDTGLAQLREIAFGLPGTYEKVTHGRPGFFAAKMFASYGGNSKVTRPPGVSVPAGQMVAYPHSVLIKVDDSERRALESDPRYFYPAYMGPSGWLGLDLTCATVDWGEVAELVDASYRLVASARHLKLLEER